KYAEEWLSPENTAHILNILSEAAFTGNRKMAEEAIREVFSCEIAIHDNPSSLDNLYNLKTIKIHTGVLRKFFNENQPKMWKIEDNNIIFDEAPDIKPTEISNSEEIMPYGFYIVHPDYIKYKPGIGLLFEPGGENFECIEKIEHERPEYDYKKETWVEHSQKTLRVFETILLPRYKFAIEKFGKAWDMSFNDFIDKMKIAILLHDIGKLNREWQKKAGWKEGEEPLAHSENKNITKFPSHAPISTYALSPLFYEWGEQIGQAFYFAVAHHHSVRASKVPKYKLIDNWQKYIKSLSFSGISKINQAGGRCDLASKFPEMTNYSKLYRTYTLISRILRLSDRIATGGGEHAVLLHENWYGNV
ncbi:MAG TPA: CRISPR-associated endonuclease Cas3'', partial [Candidatus Omnitrophica bacterium]|nr:CRISPR-associated endonuclease Cas3'' [Candidatus Omnitrophota bacterium]